MTGPLGGEIEAASTPGKGSRFTLTLVLVPQEQSAGMEVAGGAQA